MRRSHNCPLNIQELARRDGNEVETRTRSVCHHLQRPDHPDRQPTASGMSTRGNSGWVSAQRWAATGSPALYRWCGIVRPPLVHAPGWDTRTVLRAVRCHRRAEEIAGHMCREVGIIRQRQILEGLETRERWGPPTWLCLVRARRRRRWMMMNATARATAMVARMAVPVICWMSL